MAGNSEFVVVANRLPVDHVTQPDGTTTWRRSPGGLVTAVEPLMQQREGAWIGWSGAIADCGLENPEPFTNDDIDLYPVPLTESEITDYYEGFSNTSLWPLYHDVIVRAEYHRQWWNAYQEVNQRFAARAAEVAATGAFVWVHDYQLHLVPAMLRELRPDVRIGFFLHIPFPPTELFSQLPWRTRILEGMLGADLVGFQTPPAASNFLRLTRDLLGLRPVRNAVEVGGRSVRAKAFPISIDTAAFANLARRPDIRERAAEIRRELGDPSTVLLGVDRLDYTKGINTRLQAFEELLEGGQVKADDVVMVQVATPSRERVEQYRMLREHIEQTVGRINGQFGLVGNPALTYIHRAVPRDELVALYVAADVMLITPFRDGMNLVAKEYVACRLDDTGALVLSEFAGAALELRQAYLVNPYDIDGVKRGCLRAVEASESERASRMRVLRRQVQRHDVTRWANSFVAEMDDIAAPGKDES